MANASVYICIEGVKIALSALHFLLMCYTNINKGMEVLMKDYQILDCAVEMGNLLLRCGAEIYRVEESIRRICSAYGLHRVEVFAIPSSIVVTITDDDGRPLTKTRRPKDRTTDLDRIDRLNDLCRRICRDTPSDYNDLMRQYHEIMGGKNYPQWLIALCFAAVGFFFTLFFGGNMLDAAVCAFVSALIMLVSYFSRKFQMSDMFYNIFCSGMSACLAVLAVRLGLADNYDKIVIGALMNLVPGIALTNCMRDFIAGDFLAGLSRMAEVLLTAAGIAIGVVITLALFTHFSGRIV